MLGDPTWEHIKIKEWIELWTIKVASKLRIFL
jgi:hypothetical protein